MWICFPNNSSVNFIKVKFIPAIENWAICDNLCCNAKWVKKEDKDAVWEFVEGLIASEGEFRCRK